MRTFQYYFYILVTVVLGGCAWLAPSKKAQTVSLSDSHIQLIDASLIPRGSTLKVLPFRAGPGIEAGKDFDKMAFSLSRGLVQGFQPSIEYFQILENFVEEEPDFIARGRIVDFGTRSWIQKMFFRRLVPSLSVEGEIIQSSSGKILVVFHENRRAKSQQQSHSDVAYLIGQNIAVEILGKIQ